MPPRVQPLRLVPLFVLAWLLAAGCGSVPRQPSAPLPFPNAPVPPSGGVHGAPGVAAAALVDLAMSLRGVRYRFGGADPAAGFDCSGLVRYVFAHFSVDVPRTVAEQYGVGRKVPYRQLAAGDLVFFATTARGPTHVGIVVDPEQRTFVHAPGTGSVVRVDRYDAEYWRRRMLGARRLPISAAVEARR